MKLMTCAVLALGLLSSEAMAAKVTWRGAVCITSIASACPAGDWVITCYSMAYRPPNIGDNGAASRFSFGDERFRYVLTLASGTLVGSTMKAVDQKSITTFNYGPDTGTTMRFSSQKPSTLTATTSSIEFKGDINNIDGTPGCNLGFTAAAVLAPN